LAPRVAQDRRKVQGPAVLQDGFAGKSPPHDPEAEQAVAGLLLFFASEVAEEILAQLTPQDFYLDRPRAVFLAAMDLFGRGQPINLISVRDWLAAQGKLDEGWHTWAIGLEALLVGPSMAGSCIQALRRVRERRQLRQALLEALQWIDEKDPAVIRDDLARRLEELGRDGHRKAPQAEDAATFLSRQITSQLFLIEPCLLPRGGKGFIGGAPKLGKSLLALHMCVALAAGKYVLTLFEAAPSRVLYMNFEVAEGPFRERLQQVVDSFGLDPTEREQALKRLFVVSPGPIALNQQAGFLWVRAQIQRCQPDVVVLDPMVKAHTLDENSGSDMQRFLNDLDRLTREFGVAWLIVHHYHKPSALAGHRSSGQMLRGSSVLFGDVDVVFGLTREDKPAEDEGPPATILEISSRYGLPLDPIPMRLEEDLAWSLIAKRGRPKKKGPAAVVEVLREKGALDYKALTEAVSIQVGVCQRTAERYVKEARQKGLVQCSMGIYYVEGEPF